MTIPAGLRRQTPYVRGNFAEGWQLLSLLLLMNSEGINLQQSVRRYLLLLVVVSNSGLQGRYPPGCAVGVAGMCSTSLVLKVVLCW